MNFSSLIQFIFGFILGVSLLVAGSATTAYFFFTKMANNPPRPVFAEEKQKQEIEKKTTTASSTEEKSKLKETETSEKTPTEPPAKDNRRKKLPPGAYYAIVNWPQGLSLREQPSIEANRIGGVGYKWKIMILGESNDKQWQRIRIPSSGQEGWVKAGNVDKVREEGE